MSSRNHLRPFCAQHHLFRLLPQHVHHLLLHLPRIQRSRLRQRPANEGILCVARSESPGTTKHGRRRTAGGQYSRCYSDFAPTYGEQGTNMPLPPVRYNSLNVGHLALPTTFRHLAEQASELVDECENSTKSPFGRVFRKARCLRLLFLLVFCRLLLL